MARLSCGHSSGMLLVVSLLLMPIEVFAQSRSEGLLAQPDPLAEVRQELAMVRQSVANPKSALSNDERGLLRTRLDDVENALNEYSRLWRARVDTRQSTAPLMALGAVVTADDASGVGIVDDVLLPFIALALLKVSAASSGPIIDPPMEEARRRLSATLAALSTAITQVMSKKNDGLCSCKCLSQNDGVYPAGRVTRERCDEICKKERGYSIALCK